MFYIFSFSPLTDFKDNAFSPTISNDSKVFVKEFHHPKIPYLGGLCVFLVFFLCEMIINVFITCLLTITLYVAHLSILTDTYLQQHFYRCGYRILHHCSESLPMII